MIERELSSKALTAAQQFPVVSITGPRQSGKSTLVKKIFPDYRYVTLEDSDTREFAKEDPRSFLALYDNRVIIDEAQRVPELFSYLQGIVDETNEPGQFILSGSQNFLLMEAVSQSLAGRVAVLNLLPLSQGELAHADAFPASVNEWLIKGGYPRIYQTGMSPADFHASYVQTYLERDVRRGSGILKLAEFERFLGLCADRVSALMNKEGLANDCGITVKTAENWLSVLEASFIVTRLQPYYKNFGKRLVKTPKLYFFDTGLVCSLLGIEDAEEIALTEYRGALFETAVVSELYKTCFAKGRKPKLYFWRDSGQKEVDLIVEKGASVWAIAEVKSSATYNPKYFKTVQELGDLAGVPVNRRYVVYAGDTSFSTERGVVLSIKDVSRIMEA
ncbi:MAG TPA: ATP-binding protein [Slackia equolifaciens]|uniref:ATP-binding protein n=1 Tax=Slackia equolifaciens TaxID=498718 RepID=A0A9D2UVD5_9ACTN|nr:ATP-binding protein [Slackia equolifaciens]